LKLESLQFLRLGITYHSPEVVQPSIAKLLPLVTKIISEDWYKSIAEALRVLAAMVLAIRPWNATTNSFDNSFNYQQFLGPIYQAILRRSEAMDIDFEIKECAITSLGVLFRQCGDHLNNDLSRVLELFHKRLDNETTRAITLKAISSIATSPLQGSLDLSAFLMVSGEELASYLRQYSRSLKQQTLQTIDALVCHPTTILNDTITTSLVKETSTLISDNDLHLAHLSLQLVISILKKNAAIAAESIANFAYEKAITLARSSLTQGQALDSLIAFFQAVLSTGHPRFHYSNIFIDLYQIPSDVSTATASAAAGSGSSFGRQGLSNLSKCIAGISSHLPTHELAETIRRIANDVDSNNDALAQLALLSIGEAGEHANLSAMTDLKDLLLKCFDRQSEDVKYAAAYALGHISVGSMGSFLPLVLQSIRATSSSAATTATRQKYLLFISLKEIIVIHANHITSLDFTSYLQDVLTLLLDELQSEEESLRNVIGDCLGVLTTILPKALIPTLVQLYNQEMVSTTESSKLALRTISHALRTALTRPLSTEASFEITSVMEQFLQLLRHIDLDVKKGGLLVVNTAVHHNPQTIHQHILTVIHPILIETLQIKLERVVDLGPFKHKVSSHSSSSSSALYLSSISCDLILLSPLFSLCTFLFSHIDR
jgi:cullin-associated NEDD8-dissociated protein 1